MKLRKAAALVVLAVSALTASTVTASADPGDVKVTASLADKSGKVVVDSGSAEAKDGHLVIKNSDGQVVRDLSLWYKIDDLKFPIKAQVDGKTITLTPGTDVAKAVYEPAAGTAPSPNAEQAQRDQIAKDIGTGAAIGAVAGGIPGAAAGCFLGGGAGAIAGGVLGFIAGGITAALLSPFLVSGAPVIAPELLAVTEALGVVGGVVTGSLAGCVLVGALIGVPAALVGALTGAAIGAVVAAFTMQPPKQN
ncbi:hypothetical protein [Nocardia huaxiensis]|uniref:hypothetical protein n=1 Tax=Nocardia huaxiensis TaxID=2755382 RepID=UPI001E2CCE63|nr:hypothetical protein [Nocardia huaxiensis]UFS95762.1 hypothetical protein LPY97_34745 [Nocardia huaxiensis]